MGPSQAQQGPGSCRSIVPSFLPGRTSCWKSRGTTRSDPLVPPAAARPLCTRHGVRCPQTADLAEDTVAAGRSQAIREHPQLSAAESGRVRGSRFGRPLPRWPRGGRAAGGAAGLGGAHRVPGLASSTLSEDQDEGTGRDTGTDVTGGSIPWALGPARTDSEPTSSLPSF